MIPVNLWKHFRKNNRDHETRAVGAVKNGQGLPAGLLLVRAAAAVKDRDAERLMCGDTRPAPVTGE